MDSRVRTRSAPEADNGCKLDAGEIVRGQLVVSRGDAAVVLQAAKHHLDAPTLGIACAVVLDRSLAVAPTGNDRLGAGSLPVTTQVVGVATAVSDEALELSRRGDECGCGLDVGGVAGCQRECERPAKEVADGVDFGGAPAAADADGLRLRPPFAPPAERCALT